MMQILGLLGMYFDAVVVEAKTFLLLFRLALAKLCSTGNKILLVKFFGSQKYPNFERERKITLISS